LERKEGLFSYFFDGAKRDRLTKWSLFLKERGKMITVSRMKVAGDENPLEIYACSEIQDMVSEISYLDTNSLDCLKNNFFVSPKILYKSVQINFPNNGTMLVVMGERKRVVFGRTEDLMAYYLLANQYQRGENSCKYCKRPDSRCQIRGFLNEMEAIV